jgi:hypothetical protein
MSGKKVKFLNSPDRKPGFFKSHGLIDPGFDQVLTLLLGRSAETKFKQAL